ncbi:MAG: HAMP domain-containing sensor histidine kinase [Pseudomonadota bacterium]
MKPFSSLFAKILLWFFLNLFLVGTVLFVFFLFQPQVDLYSIFGKQVSDRIRAAGRLMSHDLAQTEVGKWPAVLTRHGEIYQVDFVLFMDDGSRFLSREMEIPEVLMKQVTQALQSRAFGRGRNQGNRFGSMPMRHKMMQPAYEECFPVQERFQYHPMMQEERMGRNVRLAMTTNNPTRHWAGTPIFLFAGPSVPPITGMLVAVSDSITGNGFFFDPLPWIAVAAVVIILSVLVWIPLVRNITRPLTRMTRAAEEIANGRFDVTIREKRNDEIGRLGNAINHMTSRLSSFVNGRKRFLGDVAHELGSPISRIQFGLGILEQHADEENRKRVADVMEDVDHMSRLVNELLSFSRAEMKKSKAILQATDLLPVVERAVQRETKPEDEIVVQVDPSIRVPADPELLTRAISNIVRNAVKYAGSAGPITIMAETGKDQTTIRIRDNGPGVPEEYLDQLFEPFFRPEPSRDRDSGGVGLGLAIVKTCIETCEGTVAAKNLQPRGFEVMIRLRK